MPPKQPKSQNPNELLDQPLPFDAEAEIGVLGSIVLEPARIDNLAMIISGRDFYDEGYGRLFEEFKLMRDAGQLQSDKILTRTALEKKGVFAEIGGSAGMAKIFQSVPNSAHAVFYANIVRNKSILRRQVSVALDLFKRSMDRGADAAEVSEWLEARLDLGRVETQVGVSSVCDVALRSLVKIDEDMKKGPDSSRGVFTGIFSYDQTFGFLMPSELIVLAARPSIGKTAMGMQIGEYAGLKGDTTLFVSLEMRDVELIDRVLAKHSGVNSRLIRSRQLSPNDVSRLRGAAGSLENLQLSVWAPHRANMQQIRAVARMEKSKGKLKLLVVDYISLVESRDKSIPRNEQVSETAKSLKALAKELDVPVLILSQLNRGAEGERPTLANLKESGAIEEDADAVIFLHRAHRDAADAEMIVAKNRNGVTGVINLQWIGHETRFHDPKADVACTDAFNNFNNEPRNSTDDGSNVPTPRRRNGNPTFSFGNGYEPSETDDAGPTADDDSDRFQ